MKRIGMLDPGSAHGRVRSWLAARQPGAVLDLGCSDGALAAELRVLGHRVTGVDAEEHPGVADRVDRFVLGDLDDGIPAAVGGDYDVVIAADVLEHVREPDRLLDDIRGRLAPGGSLVISVPNFAHWYPRLRVALGRFDYDRRGILGRGDLRFFTRRSFERLLARRGYTVRRREALTLPLELARRGGGSDPGSTGRRSWATSLLAGLDRLATALRPTLFAYQFLFEVEPAR